MSRPALPEERGHDERPDLLSLDELKRCHDWREENRDMHEPGDGALSVLVCRQCGYERLGSRRGRSPDCPVRDLPTDAVDHVRHRGLIPETASEGTEGPGDALKSTGSETRVKTHGDLT